MRAAMAGAAMSVMAVGVLGGVGAAWAQPAAPNAGEYSSIKVFSSTISLTPERSVSCSDAASERRFSGDKGEQGTDNNHLYLVVHHVMLSDGHDVLLDTVDERLDEGAAEDWVLP